MKLKDALPHLALVDKVEGIFIAEIAPGMGNSSSPNLSQPESLLSDLFYLYS